MIHVDDAAFMKRLYLALEDMSRTARTYGLRKWFRSQAEETRRELSARGVRMTRPLPPLTYSDS